MPHPTHTPRTRTPLAAAALLALAGPAAAMPITIDPVQDVMASPFFFAPDTVRGYDADDRFNHRVSSDDPFGQPGAETIYIQFDPADFASLAGPVPQALLSVESVDGLFGGNADADNPFTVSAHAVATDPIATITDDTNPSGTKSFTDFYGQDILAADPAALTVIDGFGTFSFDVTAIVNDWVAGSNGVYFIALTGKNDTSGGDFLHGFMNNTETPGSTTLTLVPEPVSAALLLLGGTVMLRRRRA